MLPELGSNVLPELIPALQNVIRDRLRHPTLVIAESIIDEVLRRSSGGPQEILRRSSGDPQEILRKSSGDPQKTCKR